MNDDHTTRLRTVPRPPGAPARDDPRDWPSESSSELIERLERELARLQEEKIRAPRNFCPACGERTPAGSIHTCAPEAP